MTGHISLIKSDLFDLNELPQVDAIIYLVQLMKNPKARMKQLILMVQKNMAIMQTQPPKRFIFASSTAVYPFDDGSWVDEATLLPKATAMNGLCLQEAEKHIYHFNATQSSRIGGIYGQKRYYIIDKLKGRYI